MGLEALRGQSEVSQLRCLESARSEIKEIENWNYGY
jgi:hypothetical protein